MLGSNITAPLIGVLGIIIVMAGFGLMVSAINDWSLMTYNVGLIDGQRVERFVGAATGETADQAWYDNALTDATGTATELEDDHFVTIKQGTGTACLANGGTWATAGTGFSQAGTAVSITAGGVITGCTWAPSAGIWDVGGFKDLIRLVYQASSLGLPIGVLFVLYTFGNNFLTNMGANPILAVIILIIAFLLATRLLDALVPYIDAASDAIGSPRFLVYQEGLGKLSVLIRNFYGIVIGASLLKLGWEAVKLFRGASSGMGSSFGMGGGGGYGGGRM